MMSPVAKGNLFLSVGTILVIICAIFMGCFGLIFTSLLNKMLIVDPDGKMFKNFDSPTVPIYMDFYIFNVTNPEEVQHYGAKPKLVELGPYSYLEKMQKHDYTWNDAEGTVEYKQNKTYFFDEERSKGKLSDQVTTLNSVMVVLGSRIHGLNSVLKAAAELLFLRFNLNENLFIRRKVSELLFEGYYDPMVEMLGQITGDPVKREGKFGFYYKIVGALTFESKLVTEIIWPEIESGMDLFQSISVDEMLFLGFELPKFDFRIPFLNRTQNLNGTIYDILSVIGIEASLLEPNKFGYYYGKNGSDNGLFKVNTGALGMEDYLYIQEWENNDALDYWGDPYCNMINGTDGTQYPPGVQRETTIRLFSTDLCRSLSIDYEKDVNLHDTTLYRFVLSRSVLEIKPKTKCFCKDEFTCKDSMVNVKACKKGVPLVLSTPHFYQGDPEDINKLDGLNPQKELHETYLDIEPTTGVVMEAAKKIQVNLPLKRYGHLPSFMNVPELIFPVLWASENAQIPKDKARSLNKVLTLPYLVVYVICGVIIVIGLVLIGSGFIKRKRAKNAPKGASLIKN